MPTKQGGRALKNASTSDRCSFRRNTALPAASTPCSWRTRLAMSKPTVVISIVDGSFSLLHSTARVWHIDAVRGRPPHQVSSASSADRRRNGGTEILRAAIAAEIGGAGSALGKHLRDRALDGGRGGAFAKVVQHHRTRPDLTDRVGDAAAGNVRRRAVHRLEHRGIFALGIDVTRRRD